ncbi:MAG: putative lipid II flippase FtsW [Ruminococcaceae bacterium]|nr:putative lipid II flippase FtsW [Oscillospiraceae bacterium]
MHDDRRNYNYRSGNGNRPANRPGQNPTQGRGQSQQNAQRQPAQTGQTRQIPAQNGSQQNRPARQMPARTPAKRNTKPTAAAPAKKKPEEGALSFWKRTFAVDPSVFEQRDLVREKGSVDYVFLILVLILLAFGTVMVYSASYAYAKNEYGDSYYIIFRQFIFIVVGFIGMAFAAVFPPEFYRKVTIPYYIVCFFLLALVPIIGQTHHGAKRWISLGFTEIQPSEFMKLGLVLMLAWYFDRYYERVTDTSNIVRSSFFGSFVPLAITGVTCVLVVIEKHMSGTIIMLMIGLIVIFSSGTPLRVLLGLGGAGIGVLGLFSLITDYTKRRIDIWLHPEKDPLDGGYQTLQGLYAIGSGGFFGVGLGESRQKHMYVSQPQNDFIFTIVCEELGFLGASAVIILFVLFVWRGFVIAMKAPDTFSSLVVVGIVGKVALQSILNIAVVTNSMPNTGISLPFFSYGGSSLCVLMVEMGIVLSISRYSRQKK